MSHSLGTNSVRTMDGITVYNLPARPPNWDGVGIFYITYAAVWTIIVASGMIFCLWNLHIPALKIRSLPLAFSGILLLHLYWCMAQIVYPIAGTMPIVIAYEVQYFIMGTWFPLGLALFHAANLRFLRVAELQKQFESTSPTVRVRAGEGARRPQTTWLGRWRAVKYDNKIFILLGVGMVFMTILTFGIGLRARSTIPDGVFQVLRLLASLFQSRSSTWVGDGSGGRRFSGNLSGPGGLLHS